ncbi:hypothetical protein CMI47_10190 [Candidatus Pacearchaeota archaeon]|nr:hypothetical protein [Candidatus Pacearchaeota archaeon]
MFMKWIHIGCLVYGLFCKLARRRIRDIYWSARRRISGIFHWRRNRDRESIISKALETDKGRRALAEAMLGMSPKDKE